MSLFLFESEFIKNGSSVGEKGGKTQCTRSLELGTVSVKGWVSTKCEQS